MKFSPESSLFAKCPFRGFQSKKVNQLVAFWVDAHAALSSADFIKKYLLRNFFEEYRQRVKWFSNVISRRHYQKKRLKNLYLVFLIFMRPLKGGPSIPYPLNYFEK